jgi:hypothetical protein
LIRLVSFGQMTLQELGRERCFEIRVFPPLFVLICEGLDRPSHFKLGARSQHSGEFGILEGAVVVKIKLVDPQSDLLLFHRLAMYVLQVVSHVVCIDSAMCADIDCFEKQSR